MALPEMKGFSVANLHNMRRFAERFADLEFLQQVAGELPWYHHVLLMERIKEHQERVFYILNAVEFVWSRAMLKNQIELDLYKRQGKAVTNFKGKLPSATSDLANQTLKDPYIFDFLSEREMEKALILHMENFILELGLGNFFDP